MVTLYFGCFEWLRDAIKKRKHMVLLKILDLYILGLNLTF